MSAASDLMAMLEVNSIETAMATTKEKFASDWVVLVDAYPSLDPTADQPIPACDVTIIICDPAGKLHHKTVKIGGHPSIIQPRIAKTAMQFLRQQFC
jgi:nicotinamide-nucleotide amidase